MRMLRTLLLLTGLLLVVSVAAACGGGGGDDDDERAATEAPPETDEPDGSSFGAGAISIAVEGDFVGPDSHYFLTTYEFAGLSGTEEGIAIGEMVWYREGNDEEWTSATRSDPDALDLLDLTSADAGFLQDMDFAQDLTALDSEPEELNGVQTRKYFIPRETVAALAGLFGEDVFGDAEGLQEFEMTVWLDEETDAVVRIEMAAVAGPEFLEEEGFPFTGGSQVELSIIVDLSEINEDIEIEPPEGEDADEPAGSNPFEFDSFHYEVEISFQVLE